MKGAMLNSYGMWIAFTGLGVLIILGAGVHRPDDSERSLLAAREAVWRDYFAYRADLVGALPENFVGIAGGDSVWQNQQETLAASRASAARGVRLSTLNFPRNLVQRYGEVAIIHSRYEAVLNGPDGKSVLRGNITEVFVWNGTRWIHPSWHMDFDRSPSGLSMP